ncbi:hypothetical protein AAFF_G00384180 [Aldrovandia affinis]|uniref:Receptor-interacting serine/threonine-protein kinase 1 n=1 Tax=Aldrovandia affinis TaxID=143900 RepID=A0AAD7SFB0_9TELE|nr:hypothetical protein AAFF_G00384180 [Aldrovandia affinis]
MCLRCRESLPGVFYNCTFSFNWTRFVRKYQSSIGRCYVKRRIAWTAMAASPESIYMNSADLIKKEPLDYGGFGQVYLCYHKTHGQVVLKTVYTGPPRNEGNKRSLMEEGSLMHKLNHERIVKLLGVILEDGAYSLVMELIPKGNLLSMLQEAAVPISIKGRIILEILEGMVYLTRNNIIHKDLKPENILVDKDFHIKIADLGLAICQSWSRLTKEESRRQSRKGGRSSIRTAGTLCYMAPEHLDSIHTLSSEKSDVYSFSIVVWVILTCQEPYENARSEDHICQCVRKGDRPDESAIPPSTPQEIITMMKQCWHHKPEQRPTFAESHDSFEPFYRENLEKDVKKDSSHLMATYEGPDHFLETMKSVSENVSLGRLSLPADPPAPLRSSDSMPIEASIEDLVLSEEGRESSIQADAAPLVPRDLKQKLDQELDYHQRGSYSCVDHSPHLHPAPPEERGIPQQVSSVQSWSSIPKAREDLAPLFAVPSRSDYRAAPIIQTPSPSSLGLSPVSPYSPLHHHPAFHRLHSCPANPVPESEAPDFAAGTCHNSAKMPSPDQGSLYIQNASGIQIGHNNHLSIRSQDSGSSSYQHSTQSSKHLYKELLQQYEDWPVSEEHLDVLRENIGAQWKHCARRLGLTETEVETIDHDYARDGLKEKVYQMLERWRMKEGFVGCTVGRLCRALSDSIKVDQQCRLLHLCKKPTSP